MREIKFRAWDESEQRYWTQEEMEDIGGYYYSHGVSARKGYILEQFTGLIDRNGKEIWEGDIITDFHGDKRLMVFADNGFWCVYPNGDKHLPTREYREVIGNVHETP